MARMTCRRFCSVCLGRVDGIDGRSLADGSQEGGLSQVDLCNRFAEVELRGGFCTIGVMTVIGAIQVPFQHLLPPIAGCDLRCQHAFMDGS